MTRLGGWSQSGSAVIEQTTEYELTWGGDNSKGMVLTQKYLKFRLGQTA
jgi:hypothetical protein